jgi:hypothetical protein
VLSGLQHQGHALTSCAHAQITKQNDIGQKRTNGAPINNHNARFLNLKSAPIKTTTQQAARARLTVSPIPLRGKKTRGPRKATSAIASEIKNLGFTFHLSS